MPNNQELKIKLLVLYDLFFRYTDEEHVLSTSEIMEMLAQSGIEFEDFCQIDLQKHKFKILSTTQFMCSAF